MDCVLALGAAWFLDNGDGSTNFDGTFRGKGVSTTPVQVIRVDLTDGSVSTTAVCDAVGGLIANPPLIDPGRRIRRGLRQRQRGDGRLSTWPETGRSRRGGGGGRTTVDLVLLEGPGVVLTGDHDCGRSVEQAVALDVTTGEERSGPTRPARCSRRSSSSSVTTRAVYWCSMSSVSRIRFGLSRPPGARSGLRPGRRCARR